MDLRFCCFDLGVESLSASSVAWSAGFLSGEGRNGSGEGASALKMSVTNS